jgi:hypothetical protein
MRKKIFLITAFCSLFGVFGVFAQSGNDPKLATSGGKTVKAGSSTQTPSVKPALATGSAGKRQENTPSAARIKQTPKLAAGSNKNGVREPEKKQVPVKESKYIYW